MTCEYWDKGVPPELPMLIGADMRRVVLDSDVASLTRHHELGVNLSHALEYAAQLGKRAVTRHLTSIGVPITRFAISCAAKRRGQGVDLLLAATRAEHLERAKGAAITFRMVAGDFDRAFELIEGGARLERYFISGAYSGSRNCDDHPSPFHEALDRMLRHISKTELAESTLHLLVEHGRPIHVERTLMVLGRPVAALFPHVVGVPALIDRLREFGFRMGPASFEICVNELRFDITKNPGPYLRKICELAIADGADGKIGFDQVRKLTEAYVGKLSICDRVRMTEAQDLSQTLALVTRCIAPEERARLHEIVDVWNQGKSEFQILSEQSVAQLHGLIDAAVGEQFEYETGCSP